MDLPSPHPSPTTLEKRHASSPHPTALGTLMAASSCCCVRQDQSKRPLSPHQKLLHMFGNSKERDVRPPPQGCRVRGGERFSSGVGGGQRQPAPRTCVPFSRCRKINTLCIAAPPAGFLKLGISPQGGKEQKGFAGGFRGVQGPCGFLHVGIS